MWQLFCLSFRLLIEFLFFKKVTDNISYPNSLSLGNVNSISVG